MVKPAAVIAQESGIAIPVLPIPATLPPSSQNSLPTSAITNRSVTDAIQGNIIDLPNVTPDAINQFNENAYGSPTNATMPPGSSAINTEFGFRLTEQTPIQTRLSPSASFSDQDNLNATSCTYYSPNSNNLLGVNAAITVTEFSESFRENTVFRYQQYAQLGAGANSYPVIVAERTYILNDTPLAEARRDLVRDRDQYARFLGLPTSDPLIRKGFGAINQQLACGQVDNRVLAFTPGEATERYQELALNTTILNAIALSTSQANQGAVASVQEVEPFNSFNSFIPAPVPATSLANLPDGNYRVISTSNDVSNGTVSTIEPGSERVFTFRKSGNSVVGNFAYQSGEASACVAGTLAGDTVIGSAYTSGKGSQVLGQSYLGSSLSLQLGNPSGGNRYDDSTLNLSGFSRLNAGEVPPPTSCG